MIIKSNKSKEMHNFCFLKSAFFESAEQQLRLTVGNNLKRAPGPFPVILNQDLYSGSYPSMVQNTTGTASVPGGYFVQRGFIFVHLHDRGTGGSQGNQDAEMGPRIGLDGTEIAYWAANPNNVARPLGCCPLPRALWARHGGAGGRCNPDQQLHDDHRARRVRARAEPAGMVR